MGARGDDEQAGYDSSSHIHNRWIPHGGGRKHIRSRLEQDGRGGGRGGLVPTAKTVAPVDFTGYWSAVVVEDWRYRMLPPEKFAEKQPSVPASRFR